MSLDRALFAEEVGESRPTKVLGTKNNRSWCITVVAHAIDEGLDNGSLDFLGIFKSHDAYWEAV